MPKSFRFKVELGKAFVSRYWIFLLLGLILGSAFFLTRKTLLTKLNSPRFKKERVAYIGLYQLNRLPEPILKKISYGLTVVEANSKTSPSPIVDKISTSSDERTYTITLKSGVFWHNGKELSTNDVTINIPYTTTRVVDNLTFQIQLQAPFAPILTTLSKPILKNDTIGLGEYKLESFTYQDGYIKKVNLAHLTHQKSNIEYIFYPSSADAAVGFKLGEIDSINNLDNPNDIPNWPNTKLTSQIDTSRYVAIFFNTIKFPDKKLRQALAYATPKAYSKKDRAISPIDPNSWVYTNQVKEYAQNPTRAQELFKDEKVDKLQLLVNDRQLLPLAEEIKNAWNQTLKIKVEVGIRTQANIDNYDALLAISDIPTDPDQYIFWHSTQANTNITKLNSPRIDKLLEDGRQTTNLQARKSIYLEFQKALLEESPAIFLYYPTQYAITRIKS